MLDYFSTTNPKYKTLPTYLDKVRECDRDNLLVDQINALQQVNKNNSPQYIEPTYSMSLDELLCDDDIYDTKQELDKLKRDLVTLYKQLNTPYTIYICLTILSYLIAICINAMNIISDTVLVFTIPTMITLSYIVIEICRKSSIQNKIKVVKKQISKIKNK